MKHYKKQSALKALLYLVCCDSEKYLELALEHDIACSLDTESYRKSYESGEYPSEAQLVDRKDNCKLFKRILVQALINSMIWAFCIFILSLTIAWFSGVISYINPLSLNEVILTFCAVLGLWGAALQMGIKPVSWKGRTIAEEIYSLVAFILFAPIAVVGFIQTVF